MKINSRCAVEFQAKMTKYLSLVSCPATTATMRCINIKVQPCASLMVQNTLPDAREIKTARLANKNATQSFSSSTSVNREKQMQPSSAINGDNKIHLCKKKKQSQIVYYSCYSRTNTIFNEPIYNHRSFLIDVRNCRKWQLDFVQMENMHQGWRQGEKRNTCQVLERQQAATSQILHVNEMSKHSIVIIKRRR